MSTPSRTMQRIKLKRLSLGCTGTYGRFDLKASILILSSCYNAFSRLDMRVEVKIPGSVESYCVDDRGDRRETTDALWLETFLCGVLRAYSYADDGTGDSIKGIIGVRRFDPITSTEVEHKFLDAAERLFFRGLLNYIQARERD